MRALTLATATLFLIPLAAASPLLVPQQADPDVPSAGTLVASVQVFDEERFAFTEGHRTRELAVPDAAFDRVLLVWESWQDGDPWDRRFGVAIDGVEVLRGTTPRTAFAMTKDVTEYAALLSPGAIVPIQAHLGSWVGGGILASVRFEFYAADPLAAAIHAYDDVQGAAMWAYMAGGSRAGAELAFADATPSRVTLQVVTSGHGQAGEFWYLEAPPAVATFRVLVDGNDVGNLIAMPYLYALVGFSPSVVTDTVVHPVMWWSAFRAADVAGAHVGVGEIPAYRADVDATLLPLFTGTRHVEIVQDTGAGSWVTSLSVLVDA